MLLGSSSCAFVVAAALSGAALVAVGPASSGSPSPDSLASSFRPSAPECLEGNVVSPSFGAWGDGADRTFFRENRRSVYGAEIHYDLGLYFYEQGQFEMALDHYRKAVVVDPSFAEAYFGIGLVFYTLGDDENAIRFYRLSLDKNPRDADTRNNLGLIYYRRGELDLARSQIEEAVRLQPVFPDALYNLGLVYYQQNDHEVAIAQFMKALQQDPEYLRARFNLGVVYYELGRNRLAEEQWTMIQDTAPQSSLASQARENLVILLEESE